MNKIPTVFERDPQNMSRVLPDVTPGCAWVLVGGGVPTQKRDGTNVRVTVQYGKIIALEKRRNPSRGQKAAGVEPGYVEANRGDPSDQHLFAAADATDVSGWPSGGMSCEALGPKIQGGVESPVPSLYPFLFQPVVLEWPVGVAVTFETIRGWLQIHDMEGIVWHHPAGRMAKIKRRDFGFPWPLR
mgnify:FL=1